MTGKIPVRKAALADVPVLQRLIEMSVRGLQARDYTQAQIEGALQSVYGVDTRLIRDGTYFVAEAFEERRGVEPGAEVLRDQSDAAPRNVKAGGEAADGDAGAVGFKEIIVGCGGWSKRKTLFGGDQWNAREDDLLDPARDAAKIRAFFVHPDWARRGIGTLILDACESAAKAAGFKRLEMGATLSGVAFYRAKGYVAIEDVQVPLGNGEALPIVRMEKKI